MFIFLKIVKHKVWFLRFLIVKLFFVIYFNLVCNLHIAFHGCLQGKSVVGNVYAKNSGYNQVADLNNFIVIYPQVKSSIYGGNPSGCWDWWGYTNSNFGIFS